MSAASSGIQPQRADEESQVPREQKRIVVVDDDQQLADLMREFLLEEGYAVEVCAKGEQAFDFIRSRLPDLIILDVLLSGKDGRTICRKLKSQDQTRHIPIVMISAYPDAA